MRPRGVLPVIGLLLAASTVTWAIDLRDMPPWMRDMIRPVYIDWQQVAEQASLDPAGVHIRGPQQPVPAPAGVRVAAPGGTPVTAAVGSASPVVGAITPPRVTLSGSGGADAPGGTAVRAPGAVALSAHASVHVQGLGTELVGGAAVTVGGSGALSLPQSVSLSQTADQWDAMLASIEGMDEKALAQAGQIVTMVRARDLAEDEFASWARANGATPTAASVAYRLLTRERPYWNRDARVVCSALADAAGPTLEHLDDIPVLGRPGLATYLGLQGREKDVRTVLQSITDTDLDRLQPNTYHLVASTLLDCGKSLRAAIWAWKTEAARRGPADCAHICLELKLACRKLAEPDVVREELIPWAEAALAMPGSESQWFRALPILLWGYRFIGEYELGAERGRYWVAQAVANGLPTNRTPSWQLDAVRLAYSAGASDTSEVCRELRSIVETYPGTYAARRAAAWMPRLSANSGR